jgi:glutaminyl-peptide cyclotransferase
MKSALLNFYFKLTFIVLCLPSLLAYPSKCKSCKNQYGPLQLEQLKSLSVPSRLKPKGALLAPLLIPRVSGTTNNTKVRNFIVDQLTQLNWHVELDTFEDSTPHGQIEFTNVIATKNPYADTKVIFAAHFDSKYFAKPENTFIGATDSAVPCAILLDMAITLNSYLEKSQISNNSTTIQLVFFDGEEAFQEWTNDDSIYGAR